MKEDIWKECIFDFREIPTKCDVCGCKFTYMEKDIHYKEKTNSAYVICPECDYYKYPFINRKYKGDKRC